MAASNKAAMEQEIEKQVIRFSQKRPDWGAFPDQATKKNPRAQFRYVGAGGGTPDRWALGDFVPSRNFTVSMVYVPAGSGADFHCHKEEEVFFVLDGRITVSWEKDGDIVEVGLGPKDMICSPPGHWHSYWNHGVEGVYMLIMLGAGKPATTMFPERQPTLRKDTTGN